MFGKHTNFVGSTLLVLGEDLGLGWAVEGDEGRRLAEAKVPFKIVEIDPSDPIGCDFCMDNMAVYEVDAIGPLGDAGHNTVYCQECMLRNQNDPTVSEELLTPDQPAPAWEA